VSKGVDDVHPAVSNARGRRSALLARVARVGTAERNPTLKGIINELAFGIEGAALLRGLAQHPKVFNRLFVNMVKAGELGGVLEVVLNGLSEFMERPRRSAAKSRRPCSIVRVIFVAVTILTILMVFVIPRFETIFKEMLEGQDCPLHPVHPRCQPDGRRPFIIALISVVGFLLP